MNQIWNFQWDGMVQSKQNSEEMDIFQNEHTGPKLSSVIKCFIIQLHFVEYKYRPKQVQISHGFVLLREQVKQVFSQHASDKLD